MHVHMWWMVLCYILSRSYVSQNLFVCYSCTIISSPTLNTSEFSSCIIQLGWAWTSIHQYVHTFMCLYVCHLGIRHICWMLVHYAVSWSEHVLPETWTNMNRVVETTVTVLIQKYVKVCCHGTTWAIVLMTPIHFLEASGAPAFTLQQRGRITVHKRRFFLKEQLHEFT